MKIVHSFLFFSILFTSQAFANDAEVILNAKEVAANTTSVVIVRTAQTPQKVTLALEVPFARTVCLRTDTRQVYGADPSCGYDTEMVSREVCSSHSVCETSLNGVCQRYRDVGNCHTVTEPVSVMRSCYHSESFCAQYGTRTDTQTEKVLLSFKKLEKLEADRQQRFLITGRQNRHDGSNDKYSASVVYSERKVDIKITDFLGDKIVFKNGE